MMTPAQLEAARNYTPRGAARELFRCKDPEILIEGGAGTGKTTAVLTKAHALCETYPGIRVLFCRETRASMNETVLVTFENKVLPQYHAAKKGPKRPHRNTYHYPNGSVIVVGGLDNTDRIMSGDYDLVCLFEATEASEEDWEKLTTRLRNGKMPYQQAIADCNPAGPDHWLNVRANAGTMTRLLSRHADNPSLTPEYLAKLAALTGVRRARYFESKWSKAEGLIWDTFDRAVHVAPPVSAAVRCVIGVDDGHTNPFAALRFDIDGDGRMHAAAEVYQSGLLYPAKVAKVRELVAGIPDYIVVCDPAAAGLIAELGAAGLQVIEANNDVLTGLAKVGERFAVAGDGHPRLTISADCPNLIREVQEYTWSDKARKEQPVKENDHACDALRYAVMHLDCSGGAVFYTDEPLSTPKPASGASARSPHWDAWLKGDDDA